MEGLKTGRIVYFVFNVHDATDLRLRRLERRLEGVPVVPGTICPAMIVAVSEVKGTVNLKVHLDGEDDHWVTAVPYNENKEHGTWHWMFEGQNTRYDPTKVKA